MRGQALGVQRRWVKRWLAEYVCDICGGRLVEATCATPDGDIPVVRCPRHGDARIRPGQERREVHEPPAEEVEALVARLDAIGPQFFTADPIPIWREAPLERLLEQARDVSWENKPERAQAWACCRLCGKRCAVLDLRHRDQPTLTLEPGYQRGKDGIYVRSRRREARNPFRSRDVERFFQAAWLADYEAGFERDWDEFVWLRRDRGRPVGTDALVRCGHVRGCNALIRLGEPPEPITVFSRT